MQVFSPFVRSVFLVQAKTDESAPPLPAELQGPFRQLQDAARLDMFTKYFRVYQRFRVVQLVLVGACCKYCRSNRFECAAAAATVWTGFAFML